jgi:hypothetical protein
LSAGGAFLLTRKIIGVMGVMGYLWFGEGDNLRIVIITKQQSLKSL